MKVSPAFSKAAGCRGGALARAPQSAEPPLCSQKIRKGSKGETLSRGFLLFSFGLCVCAVTFGGGRYPLLPVDPISLVLAQRNGVEPPKKSAFYPGGSTIRVSAPASVVVTHLRPTWGGGGWLTGQSQLDAVGCDVGASSSWERRVGPNMSRGGTQKRVSLGLHPVSLRKSKEMGWNGQQGGETTSPRNGAHAPALAHLLQSKTAVRGGGGFISRRCTPSRGSRARRGRSRGGGRPRGGRGCPPRARRRRRRSPASSRGTPRPRRPF